MSAPESSGGVRLFLAPVDQGPDQPQQLRVLGAAPAPGQELANFDLGRAAARCRVGPVPDEPPPRPGLANQVPAVPTRTAVQLPCLGHPDHSCLAPQGGLATYFSITGYK